MEITIRGKVAPTPGYFLEVEATGDAKDVNAILVELKKAMTAAQNNPLSKELVSFSRMNMARMISNSTEEPAPPMTEQQKQQAAADQGVRLQSFGSEDGISIESGPRSKIS